MEVLCDFSDSKTLKMDLVYFSNGVNIGLHDEGKRKISIILSKEDFDSFQKIFGKPQRIPVINPFDNQIHWVDPQVFKE